MCVMRWMEAGPSLYVNSCSRVLDTLFVLPCVYPLHSHLGAILRDTASRPQLAVNATWNTTAGTMFTLVSGPTGSLMSLSCRRGALVRRARYAARYWRRVLSIWRGVTLGWGA